MRQNEGRILYFLDFIGLGQNAIQLQILFLKTRKKYLAGYSEVIGATQPAEAQSVGGEGYGCLYLGFKDRAGKPWDSSPE